MRVRAGLVSVIYQKALVLSTDERGRASGDIVNLMSVDATRLQDLCSYGLIAFSGPLQVRYLAQSLFFFSDPPVSDHVGIHLSLQPSWVVCLCRRSHHDHIYPSQYNGCSFPQEIAGNSNEKSRQAHSTHE